MNSKVILLTALLSVPAILWGQDCTIISKANNISPDKLCSPVTVTWNVTYNGVNNAGKSVMIRFRWDDGSSETANAVNTSGATWQASVSHTYTSKGDECNYHPQATLIVNGVECSSSTQQQIVTVWDDDDHNGGKMAIDPGVFPVCLGSAANARFRDNTRFNCVPPQEKDVPNMYTRWVQWIYGTGSTMTGIPVTINGTPRAFPWSAPVITLTGPVTASGILSDIINVAGDKLLGQYFQVTLRNWNYCNPYDDPNIPGPPADPANGDHPPVTTTAIVLIVAYPDATITPVDTLCTGSAKVTMTAKDPGGTWSGTGISGDKFDPATAGPGNHLIRYSVTNPHGCTDEDQVTITVMPAPPADLTPVGTQFVNGPPVQLSAAPPGGTFSGNGITGSVFYPGVAGTGTHIITYTTLTDRFGCSGTDTIHVRVIKPPLPEALFEPDTVGCTPLKIRFRDRSINADSYLWDFGDKGYSTERNPEHTYYVPGNYIVRLTVKNPAGEDSHEEIMKVFQNPVAVFNIYPTEIVNSSQITAFYNYSQYAVHNFWNFGDGTSSTDVNPYHKYDKEGKYSVVLTVTSADGCIDSAEFPAPVTVKYTEGSLSYANAFVWNRTGPTGGYWEEGEINDHIFRPHFTNVSEYHLQIFNRLGVLVFETKDLRQGWDGYVDGRNRALQGVYVWRAKGRYADGTYFDKAGDVTFLH
ncbi:MAG: PKD domain-containing protein [Bacteroidales bacterium]|nr:PKD domain-containing protein [Bacteroidales bacterium]